MRVCLCVCACVCVDMLRHSLHAVPPSLPSFRLFFSFSSSVFLVYSTAAAAFGFQLLWRFRWGPLSCESSSLVGRSLANPEIGMVFSVAPSITRGMDSVALGGSKESNPAKKPSRQKKRRRPSPSLSLTHISHHWAAESSSPNMQYNRRAVFLRRPCRLCRSVYLSVPSSVTAAPSSPSCWPE